MKDEDALYLFGKNKPVDEYNEWRLGELDGDSFTVEAKLIGKPQPKVKENRIADTQFLKFLTLKIGARVILIHNIMTADGLTNGACGNVVAVLSTGDHIDAILVLFENAAAVKWAGMGGGCEKSLVEWDEC